MLHNKRRKSKGEKLDDIKDLDARNDASNVALADRFHAQKERITVANNPGIMKLRVKSVP